MVSNPWDIFILMKQSQLKALIKEIVAQVMDAVNTQKPSAYEDLQGWSFATGHDDLVDFEGVLLPDGREVNISVEFEGSWDDGAFDYEYGSIGGLIAIPSPLMLIARKLLMPRIMLQSKVFL